ncbi:hypothetical protein AYK20_09830 [Thermoplasmatales archaeon SG8-52-1]|nr:MAG: hypothetical protein AYK20_09830 [Thermoplasmatales archaeon SG8-52-1]
MKFLLIKPGDHKTSNLFSVTGPSNHPPLGLLSLGAMLESEGHDVEILDYYMEDMPREKLENYLLSSDAVGMTVLTEDIKAAVDISGKIKEIDPNIKLIIGGPHCTFLKQRSLQDIPHADICVVGEGEFVILELVKYLKGEKKLADIHGVYYRDNSLIKSGKPLQVIDDLDALPFPARHLVDKYDYAKLPWEKQSKKKVTSMISSRGCPYKCRFCARYGNSIEGWSYRKRSAENIVKEILEIDKKYGTLWIVDDNFLADKNRAHIIFDKLLENGIDINFLIEGARVDSTDRELYMKMKKVGVKLIGFGIESGNQDVLDFYNKKVTLQQIREAVELAREMNFFTYGSFILGAPIETRNHIENTIKFAYSLKLDFANFGELCYAPGSQLWAEAVKNKKISEDETDVMADSRRGLGNLTHEELREYTNRALKNFYFRPTYLLSQIYRAFLRKDLSLLTNGMKFASTLS